MDKTVERSALSKAPRSFRRRTAALAVAAGTLLGACGSDDTTSESGDTVPSSVERSPGSAHAPQSVPETSPDSPSESSEGVTPRESPVRRDLGLALDPASDVPNNLLPSVEVHDVGQDRMVNFRNIFPAERPVLLWMWAPY